jgi:hypothetical protein
MRWSLFAFNETQRTQRDSVFASKEAFCLLNPAISILLCFYVEWVRDGHLGTAR